MKLLFVVLIFVVIGSMFFLTNDATAPVIPTQTTSTNVSTSTESEADIHEDETTPNIDSSMHASTTVGTDVGMEYPETDMTVPNSGSVKMQIDPNAKLFTVTGSNFVFDVEEIRVKEGDTVTIHFMSAEGVHDFVIDEFNVQTQKVGTGEVSSVTFVADKKGTFEYYCSIGSHRANGMEGKLIVE